jgi:CubicO group peptidase (beta-lactamase class C family)
LARNANIGEGLDAAVEKSIAANPRDAETNQIAVAVLQGETASTHIWSRSNVQRTFQPDSRFLLYSITKIIFAAAVLRLVAAGRLKLDETMEYWLPYFPPAATISLRMLLMHTAGVANYGELKHYHDAVRSGARPWSEREFIAQSNANQLLFKPGTDYSYSNIGYMLLRRVLTRAGGGDLENILRREVFTPLGVSTASVPRTKADLVAFQFGKSRYLGGGGPAVDVREIYDPAWIAIGVVGMSVGDLVRTVGGIFGDLLPPELRDEMTNQPVRFRSQWPGHPWRAPAYGLGVMIDRESAFGPLFGHSGEGPGCSPAAYHFPSLQPPLTIAAISDGENTLPERIILEVAASVSA